MKIIYLDSDYRCHLTNNGAMDELETDAFDNMPDAFIEGYRYVPEGKTWIRKDGVIFHGLMVAPAKDYHQIMVDVATSYLNDEQAETVTILFEDWAIGTDYTIGNRRQYEGLLYKCVQAHTSQIGWEPPNVPALWVRTSIEEWPEWVQPTGAQDAYALGDKVSHNGEHWISDYDSNAWEPGVYGWSLVT